MSNDLVKLIEAFPEKQWDWNFISSNPNITWEYIQNNPQMKWDWCGISINPSVTWEIIQDNNKIKWHWHNVALNPNITFDILESRSEFSTFKEDIIRNPNTTWRDIKGKYSDFNKCSPYMIMKDINVTWEDTLSNPDYAWDYFHLAKNPHFFNSLFEKNFNFSNISRIFTEQFGLYHLSHNPNFTWEHIINNPLLVCEWNWSFLSCNSNITWQHIKSNLHLPWKWEFVLQNPNVT